MAEKKDTEAAETESDSFVTVTGPARDTESLHPYFWIWICALIPITLLIAPAVTGTVIAMVTSDWDPAPSPTDTTALTLMIPMGLVVLVCLACAVAALLPSMAHRRSELWLSSLTAVLLALVLSVLLLIVSDDTSGELWEPAPWFESSPALKGGDSTPSVPGEQVWYRKGLYRQFLI